MALDDLFDIGAPIHVGQIATSYPATWRSDGHKVLLKVIHPQLTDDKELVERFRREGEAMLSVEHRCVVQLLDFGEEDDIPYLALEWVDGGTLADMIASGPIAQDKIKRLADDMLGGLSAVHAAGLLHRDLKPDNILLTRDGNAKLADFSLVGYENVSGLTRHGALIGSPAYMAPELMQGSLATAQSDLYGIGIILLEALTGSNPFAASDPMVSLNLIRTVKLPKLSDRAQINRDLARMIDTLIARDPGDRPKSAQAALSGEVATPTTAPDPQSESAEIEAVGKRSYVWLYGSGVVAVLIVIISWWMLGKSSSDSDLSPMIKSPDVVEEIVTDTIDSQISESETEQAVSELIEENSDTVSTLPAVKREIPGMPMMPNPGELTIIAIPWAQVSVDYEPVGVTPFGTLKLTPGGHYLRFDHISYPSYETEFMVIEGESDTLVVHMNSDVNVIAEPYGFLKVDDEEIGWLPGSGSLTLSPGVHLFEVTHPDLDNWSDSVNVVRGGQTITVNLKNGTMIAVLNDSGLSK